MAACEGKLLLRWCKPFIFILSVFIACSALAQTPERIQVVSVSTDKNTGQNYSPWLNDSLDSLVQEAWQDNFVYSDVMLRFKYHSTITQLKLYDWTGVFEDKPAEIYALNGSKRTLLGYFTGPGYGIFQYLNPQQPVEADAIIIHKYSNNIPQKIFVYGEQNQSLPTSASIELVPPVQQPETPQQPVDTITNGGLVKIPIDVTRWYQLNNVSDGVQGMFDGILNADVYTGWGKIFNNYDAYYPVPDNERIDIKRMRFFNYTGGLGEYPLTVSVIDSAGKRHKIGTYKGGYYNRWVGPNPANVDKLNIDTAIKNARYIVLNCWYQFPTEIEFYGTYQKRVVPETAPVDSDIAESTLNPLKNYFGVNAFEWDFEDGTNPDIVDSTRFAAMRTFTQIRHYMDWEKLESTNGGYTFSPTHSGGWNYDAMYKACKENRLTVLADLKTLPGWLLQTYPPDDRDSENVPVPYGADFADPKSYIRQAKVAFQFTARYGINKSVSKSLLSVNSTPRWTGDPVNTVKVGLGYIRYIECDNERDKWWKGRKGYQTAYEYAANMSAFYDGHKNTMGPGVGVKNADPTMKVVMGGLASANPEYVMGMIEWCKINRGYRADGSVDICWDVINYHWYSHDASAIPSGVPTRGMAPEKNNTFEKARAFVELSKKYCGNIPVWVTEAGYDANPNSPLRAIPIGSKNILATQADWILRTSFLYARAGIQRLFFYQAYDDNFENPVQYGSSGLLNQDRSRKPAADYIFQVNRIIGNYSYKSTLSKDPIVDKYVLDDKDAYVLYVPDEVGRSAQYTLELPNADSVKISTPKSGRDQMINTINKVVNGKLTVTVTEKPMIIVPYPKISVVQKKALMALKQGIGLQASAEPEREAQNAYSVNLFPNPSSKYVNVSFKNPSKNAVSIMITDAVNGRVYSNKSYAKADENFSQTIDISRVPEGVCLVLIKHDDQTMVKRVIKTN